MTKPVEEITRVFDVIGRLKTYAPKSDLLNAKRGGKWQHFSLDDLDNRSREAAAGLLNLGLKKGDRVAIMSSNLPEWNFIDYACQRSGLITAPVFPNISNEDLRYILNHSEARALFISDTACWKKVAALEKDLQHLRFVFTFQPVEGVKDFSELVALGVKQPRNAELERISESITGEDVFTILYTSGTTGLPKGVMLTHRNLVSNMMICKNIAPFTNKWRALSFLPLNHVYERFLNALYLYHGVSIYYAESFETIGDNCREIHPQMFVAVPRILERVLERIAAAGEKLEGFRKKIFDWSMKLAERYELHGANGPWYELQRFIADKLVFKKWRAAVGGEISVIVSGGAALNPRIERIFTCAGLNLLQGYGLTETCVVVAVNRYEKRNRCFGTVGIVVENTEVRLAEEDGEILVKGPSVMKGYFKNPEATAEAIDEQGWFHTGDIGTWVEGRFLKITDRKKELFKTSAGKYISPVGLENRLKECKYIEQCMVIGDGQKYASALIVAAGDDEQVKQAINEHVKRLNAGLAPYEQIRRHRLVEGPWTVEGGEITPKLSLKRKVIAIRYEEVIREIFGAD